MIFLKKNLDPQENYHFVSSLGFRVSFKLPWQDHKNKIKQTVMSRKQNNYMLEISLPVQRV